MASFRKRGPYQWQAQVRKKGQPLQSKTFETRAAAETWARAIEVEMDKGVFVSRAEAEATTLKELLQRYLEEITPSKKGAAPEANRIRAFMRHPLARRFVAERCGGQADLHAVEILEDATPLAIDAAMALVGDDQIEITSRVVPVDVDHALQSGDRDALLVLDASASAQYEGGIVGQLVFVTDAVTVRQIPI
jgi:hypothetical protein